MIIAAQNEQENACLLLYKMEEQVNEWAFVGEIATQLLNFGYMWECPDFSILIRLTFYYFVLKVFP